MRRLWAAVIPLAAVAITACGYPDPYAGTGPVANESPGPASIVSPSPGTDNFNDGAGLPVITYPDGLKYIDVKVGTGDVVKSGNNITVQYTGWLDTAKVFDSSRLAGRTPFALQIGRGQEADHPRIAWIWNAGPDRSQHGRGHHPAQRHADL